MDKKDLKWYESPVMEVVDVEVEGQLLAGSTKGNAEGIDEEELTEG